MERVVKARIEQKARELGFDACGFTDARRPESADRFEHWLKEGRHGTMGYLARNAHKRTDPQAVLRGARSLITLAASYALNPSRRTPPPAAPAVAGMTAGTIARYARFRDYHAVLGARLRELVAFIDGNGGSGTRSLWYVDTGPVLERDMAQRSGLGFIGKHTNVINRRFGNWILLAEILTTLELEPDSPGKNRCGCCERCIAACPTQAITAPFRLDARRCISYLTIELKTSIPVELRSAIGHRIFGCDDCLEVCPWNRFAHEGALMRAHVRDDLDGVDLLQLLELDDHRFAERFSGTPMERSKRRGLLRNACVALGNIADRRALPALGRAVNDREPLIAEHAAWAIEQILARTAAAGKGDPPDTTI